MRRWLGWRPSPAMFVALIALAVALSGTAVAGEVARFAQTTLRSGDKTIKKKSLSGNRIRPRSVPGNRLRRDSLTSEEIAESRLRTVPLAARSQMATRAQEAATATTAGVADRLDQQIDVVPVFYEAQSPGGPQTIARAGGLVLTADCPGGHLALDASTSTGLARIAVTGTRTAGGNETGGGDDLDFQQPDRFDVDQAMGDGSGDRVLGRLAYTSGAFTSSGARSSVTGELWLNEAPGTSFCLVAGTLIVHAP